MRGSVLRMWLTVIISLALTQGRVEIIKGGQKKKRPAVVAPADTSQADSLAARERALKEKEKELEEKEKHVDSKGQALDQKQKDLDEREEALKAEKEEEKKRSDTQKKQAEKLQRDTNAVMGNIGDALGGN